MNRYRHIGAVPAITFALLLAGTGPQAALAQQAPPSYIASPDVYTVVAETERFRVILATWKPGQRDAPHSHPLTVVYYETGCDFRFFGADSSSGRDVTVLPGHVSKRMADAVHSTQNIGTKDCRALFIEMN